MKLRSLILGIYVSLLIFNTPEVYAQLQPGTTWGTSFDDPMNIGVLDEDFIFRDKRATDDGYFQYKKIYSTDGNDVVYRFVITESTTMLIKSNNKHYLIKQEEEIELNESSALIVGKLDKKNKNLVRYCDLEKGVYYLIVEEDINKKIEIYIQGTPESTLHWMSKGEYWYDRDISSFGYDLGTIKRGELKRLAIRQQWRVGGWESYVTFSFRVEEPMEVEVHHHGSDFGWIDFCNDGRVYADHYVNYQIMNDGNIEDLYYGVNEDPRTLIPGELYVVEIQPLDGYEAINRESYDEPIFKITVKDASIKEQYLGVQYPYDYSKEPNFNEGETTDPDGGDEGGDPDPGSDDEGETTEELIDIDNDIATIINRSQYPTELNSLSTEYNYNPWCI